MNYTFQSFTFRRRDKMTPFYALIANIAADDKAHEVLSGVDIGKLLAILDISDKPSPEVKRQEARGLSSRSCSRCEPDD
jgi:Mn-containing catalase